MDANRKVFERKLNGNWVIAGRYLISYCKLTEIRYLISISYWNLAKSLLEASWKVFDKDLEARY